MGLGKANTVDRSRLTATLHRVCRSGVEVPTIYSFQIPCKGSACLSPALASFIFIVRFFSFNYIFYGLG